jgi:uncharacterized phage protein (TIGR01671 family)
MREIKFRAWDKKDKCMLDWSCIYQSAFNEGDRPLIYHVFMSPNITLMQYTGRKDKNGKDVYCEDIIERVSFSGTITRGIIVYSDFYCAFVWQTIENYKEGLTKGNADFLDHDTFSSNIGFEIIGNVYENPELLKETE